MLHSHVDAFLQLSWANPCFDLLQALFVDSSREDGSSGSAISCLIIGPACNALDKTGTDIGRRVRELDRFGDVNSIFCYFGLTEGLVDKDIATALKMTYPPGPSVTATACSKLTHPSIIFLRAAAPKKLLRGKVAGRVRK
jgi:hypothetical protein